MDAAGTRESMPGTGETMGSGGWATGGGLDLNQLLMGPMVACVCASVHEAAGRPGGRASY